MSKISALYVAVDYKDADYFLIKLFNKIHNKTSIVRFNRKTFILETETCTVGIFIINSPHRTKTLRDSLIDVAMVLICLERQAIE